MQEPLMATRALHMQEPLMATRALHMQEPLMTTGKSVKAVTSGMRATLCVRVCVCIPDTLSERLTVLHQRRKTLPALDHEPCFALTALTALDCTVQHHHLRPQEGCHAVGLVQCVLPLRLPGVWRWAGANRKQELDVH
eukprot:scaffold151516_cov19-Tisochrysis_lutea.AAC.2